MDGRRYAGGLLAGLLLGFIVVFAGSASSVWGSFGPSAAFPAGQFANNQQATSTSTLSMTTAATTATQGKSLNGSSAAPSTTTATVASSTTAFGRASSHSTNSQPDYGAVNGLSGSPASNSLPSSSLYSIVHQPVFSNVIILVPLLIAFFVGAIIYRLSSKRQEED